MPDELFDVEPDRGAVGEESKQPSDVAIVLRCHLHPGAGRAAVTGRHGDALGVKVAPPPVEGRANSALLVFLAELFDVSPSRLELVSGERSRQKRVRISGVGADAARHILDEALEQATDQHRSSRRRGR